ncbi:uncharacterized protein F4807DRAFT_403903 [Annulohypoxylon truncatum]|uniref:uncharacterized protein n=1 Tax=Annulohypoxylon truncatum TaxID=327061 RepID=UPI0020077D1C|nr:uncharacterized protein F4807DRAFT_403903 [Annulohypoxylon truncatum]KAI1214590.1 hypothetical protein F4807DRAFT_403903 [Annulohypoxylon truncatum]
MVKGYYIAMSDTSEWNDDSDGVLCLMKTKDWSWSMVSNVLQRPEEEAKERFQYLTSLAQEDGGIPTDTLGELYFLKMRRYPALLEEIAAKADEFEKAKAKLDERYATGGRSRADILAKGSRGQKSWLARLSPNGDPAEGLDSYLDSLSSARKSPSPLRAPSPDSIERAKMILRQHKKKTSWLTKHPKSALIASYFREHPELKKLNADQFFDEWDCKALATLEARQRGNKWLHLAADFANATGRAVDPEVLKAKLDKAPIMDKEESASFYGFEQSDDEDEEATEDGGSD